MVNHNKEKIDRVLFAIRDGLAPFIIHEFQKKYKHNYVYQIEKALENTSYQGIPNEGWKNQRILSDSFDALACLNLIDRRKFIFKSMGMGEKDFHYVRELKFFRNESAHQDRLDEFTIADVDRAIDMAYQLLTLIKADEQARVVKDIKNDNKKTNRYAYRPRREWVFINREKEKEELLDCLENPKISVILITGSMGIGKTDLVDYLCQEADNRGRLVYRDDGEDGDVCLESLMSEIEVDIREKDPKIFNALKHPENTDKIRIFTKFLNEKKCLLVFDNFQKIKNKDSIFKILKDINTYCEKVSVIIIDREYPKDFERSEWLGKLKWHKLNGFDIESTEKLIDSELDIDLKPNIKNLHEKASGNPQAIRMLLSIHQRQGGDIEINHLKPFNDQEVKEWLELYLKSLSKDARALLSRISILNSNFSHDLLIVMSESGEENAPLLIDELKRNHVINEKESGLYAHIPLIREYVYLQINENDKASAHFRAGRKMEDQIKRNSSINEIFEKRKQAIFHYHQAGTEKAFKRILEISKQIFGFHEIHPYTDPKGFLSISSKALESLEKLNSCKGQKDINYQELLFWLTRTFGLEIDSEKLEDAKNHLSQVEEIFDNLHMNQDQIGIENLTHFYMAKGKLMDRLGDFNEAISNLKKALTFTEDITNSDEIMKEKMNIFFQMGQACRKNSDWEKAIENFEETLKISQDSKDDLYQQICLTHIGIIKRDQEKYMEAKKFFLDAYRISERSGNSYGMGINQRQLGNIALQTGDFDNAEDIFRKQIEIEETFGSGLGYRIALGYLVDVLVEKLKGRRGEKNQVQIEEVQKKLTEYIEKCTDEDDKIGIAWSKFRNGKLELAIGNIKEGETLIREAMLFCENLGREDYKIIFETYLNNSELKLN